MNLVYIFIALIGAGALASALVFRSEADSELARGHLKAAGGQIIPIEVETWLNRATLASVFPDVGAVNLLLSCDNGETTIQLKAGLCKIVGIDGESYQLSKGEVANLFIGDTLVFSECKEAEYECFLRYIP